MEANKADFGLSISMAGAAPSLANLLSISASGLQDANLRLNVVAHNVANGNTNGFIPDRVDSSALAGDGVSGLVVYGNAGMLPPDASVPSQTDYITEGVGQILAQRAYEANARMLRTGSEIQKTIIEAFG